MMWEPICWATALLGGLVTCPAHLDRPPVRAERQLPHSSSLPPQLMGWGAGSRDGLDGSPSLSQRSPRPIPLFTNEETDDTRLCRDSPRPCLSPTTPTRLGISSKLLLATRAYWAPKSLSWSLLPHQPRVPGQTWPAGVLTHPTGLPQPHCPKGHSQAHVRPCTSLHCPAIRSLLKAGAHR